MGTRGVNRGLHVLGVLLLLGGCSTKDPGPSTDGTATPRDMTTTDSDPFNDPSDPAHQVTECGDAGSCNTNQLCVATRGALCMPLPNEGESCQIGCVLTEHCCNCTAFSCIPNPDECGRGSDCACVNEAQEGGFLELGCPIERSECEEDDGTTLTCISVDFDEDPFAAGGAAP